MSPNESLPARVQVSKQFFLWLDEPLDWTRKVRQLRLSGWIVAKQGEPLTQVRARLRGQVFAGLFDRERPEVAAHVGHPDAPRWCGFTLDVRVPFGRGRLELQVARADGVWQKAYARDVSGPLFLSAAERELHEAMQEADARRRFDFYLDAPGDWEQPTGTLTLAGWCVERRGKAITGIRATLGGRNAPGAWGLPRPDVGALYPENPHAAQSGFQIPVPLSQKREPWRVEVQSGDGTWHLLFTHAAPPLAAEASPASEQTHPGFRFYVHPPAGGWSKPVRYLHLAGWCFSRGAADVTEMRARIGRRSFRVHYGILRPDVALAHERCRGSLRSGFSTDVIVPWGRRRLVFEVRTTDGQWEEVFSQRVFGTLGSWHRDDAESAVGNYPAWIRLHDTVTAADRRLIKRHIAQFTRRPKFSILLPVYNSNVAFLRRAIESVRQQLYPDWELCAVDDASTDPQVWQLLEQSAGRDARIKILRRAQNGHISATSNDALQLATGEFVALLDHDDELAPTALYHAARELQRDADLQLLYSDEDKLDPQGRRCDPHFKPDWNPELYTSQNYVSHLTIIATELVRKVGGFRLGFEGAQDYDLTLRCIEQVEPGAICHIPHVLYHWRVSEQSTAAAAAAKPYAHMAAVRAVQEHFDRTRMAARVEPHHHHYQRVTYSLSADAPLVSIIIPTRDRAAFLRQCVESIRAKTDYPHYEFLIVDNESREPATLDYFASLADVEILRVPGEFNFSRLNNLAVAQARGTFVALLNNDLEAMDAGWLSEMVSHAARPGVGAVGARLWYPDGTLQHAGVIVGSGGIGSHAHAGLRREEDGYFSRPHLAQDLSAVTAACMLLRRDLYLQLGGLNERELAVAFNDVDFCLRLRAGGWRIIWTPHANLLHHESASRGFEDTREKRDRFLAEVDYMTRKWQAQLENDPAYNPNLSLGDRMFTLAFPPRVPKPWRVEKQV